MNDVRSLPPTHEVSNQPPPLADHEPLRNHHALREALAREGAAWAASTLATEAQQLAQPEWQERGRLANTFTPELKSHDRYGRRRDEVEFHPAWHECLGWLKARGCDTGPWADPRPGAHVARAALFMLFAEVEAGSLCPTTMTYGAVPVVRQDPALAEPWLRLLLSRTYDGRFLPAEEKRGVMIGMGLTEKQGGSDVRANTTRAEPIGKGEYLLTGHKWFLSAAMSDAFLVTAQTARGLSCFFLPRWTPDGRPNALRLLRLKDKLGDRSNATAEVEFEGAWARLVGEEGRGIPTVLEMGNYTRLDCALGSTGLMRGAFNHALHHARHRAAFGKALVDQPLMQNVLADLALEVEAATALVMRIARGIDRQDQDEDERLLRRVFTPIAKFWVCKRGAQFGAEAMEVLGGNGYVEEAPLARCYRQLPVNSIWEGSGNVMCLDVLRALSKHPRIAELLLAEVAPAQGKNAAFDQHLARLMGAFKDQDGLDTRARRLTQDLALALQGALLLQHAPDFVAEAFCASRLGSDAGAVFGTLARDLALEKILARAGGAQG
ncbi:MAG: isovaleryl-CoA dehydrogenase [Betaproteobacteria bacterium]|nr:isovaleryl-CoA dehydrogenase [Betaproteobacteria bacterium]